MTTANVSHAPAGTKELRFGLVLYGGVSLAIYMHGTTKELHRLVRASVPSAQRALTPSPSEAVYTDLLDAKAAAEGVRTRIVIDVIAGTSAGGINGVYLAKALAHDLSQDTLRDVWLERGDIGALLRGPRLLPWQVRVPWVLGTVWRTPALDGDHMAAWLFDALRDMDHTGLRAGSLLPDDHLLQLFVTVTDFHGYTRELVIADPPVIYDRRHRHVLEFRHGDGHDDFRPTALDNALLAFAARTTSSFPGAFPPVDFRRFERYLKRRSGVTVDLSAMGERRLFRQYPLSGTDPADAHFIDGGVLDNQPFAHVVNAMHERHATNEVDRRLLYLDPNPADPRRRAPGGRPSPIATILASLSGIPRNEPILDDLLAIGALNERVRQIRDVIETNWAPVRAHVEEALGAGSLDDPPEDPDDARVAQWGDRIHERAIADAGLGYALYIRAKVGAVVDTWARTICRMASFPDDSTQAAFVRTLARLWADEAGLFQKDTPEPTTTQIDFLRDLDLGYRERRLRFVTAALSWWYDPEQEAFPLPSRDELDAGKHLLYDAVATLRAALRGEDVPADLRDQVTWCFGQAAIAPYIHLGAPGVAAYLAAHGEALAALVAAFRTHLRERFEGFNADVYRRLITLMADWHAEARRRLLLRYLGFPFWDTLLFPLQSIAAAGERDHIDVLRLSPVDATLLVPPDDGPKLAGMRLHHFGAFFDRAGRERDYLWGRLDAAERLVTVLLGPDHNDHRTWCERAFAAILDEEADHLPEAASMIAAIRAQLDASQESPG